MAIDCASVAKLTFFFAGKRNFSQNKPKKNAFVVESLNQFRRLEVHKKARNVFGDEACLTTRYSATSHLHQVFSISLGFSRFFSLIFRTSKLLAFKEFNKTVIPFALVGYETGYCQLGATRLVSYLPHHIQRALME